MSARVRVSPTAHATGTAERRLPCLRLKGAACDGLGLGLPLLRKKHAYALVAVGAAGDDHLAVQLDVQVKHHEENAALAGGGR